MREIVLDTETTGLSPADGDKIIEIGCVELWNHVPTGNQYHEYINPEREVPLEASAISGLTTDFLKPFPNFARIADSFLDFIADSTLIIHNAKFDIDFLNTELRLINKNEINFDRVIDTLFLARNKFPGSPASLDALMKRFKININREKHGALLDSQILAEIYIELIGGRTRTLLPDDDFKNSNKTTQIVEHDIVQNFPIRTFSLSDEKVKKFEAMLKNFKNSMWNQ